MWIFCQKNGELFHDFTFVARGYSGFDDGDGIPEPGEGKNDPEAQERRAIGPIPRGRWRIVALQDPHPSAGPFALRLRAEPDTETFGRDGFLIHGDSTLKPGAASHGCLIFPRRVRELIWKSGDRELHVLRDTAALELFDRVVPVA